MVATSITNRWPRRLPQRPRRTRADASEWSLPGVSQPLHVWDGTVDFDECVGRQRARQDHVDGAASIEVDVTILDTRPATMPSVSSRGPEPLRTRDPDRDEHPTQLWPVPCDGRRRGRHGFSHAHETFDRTTDHRLNIEIEVPGPTTRRSRSKRSSGSRKVIHELGGVALDRCLAPARRSQGKRFDHV